MDNVDMMAEQINDLIRQAYADGTAPTECVQLLAQAVGLAVDPLHQLELLMLVTDTAGRAARDAAGRALRGEGCPGGKPATWTDIGGAASLSKDTAFRQFHGGDALSWSPAARGVRQAVRRPAAGEAR
ncbi:hypothetical protein GCM10010331_74410 [Streptomyces xanthochromogenes]|uniref:hypothetical protein n=1 Tax=Streptomyces xanthochromogenes TaxID=67384 RepID=UPI001672932B|nr:hypothetical protein [Streptomyces xanthochromogenes]GHB75714.1 hypothetical protein GCM10010331_74410 [Streptomyces xanthochromogenes]